jgi:hypothetical protein
MMMERGKGKTYSVDLSGVDAEEEGAGGEEKADCGGELHFDGVFGLGRGRWKGDWDCCGWWREMEMMMLKMMMMMMRLIKGGNCRLYNVSGEEEVF